MISVSQQAFKPPVKNFPSWNSSTPNSSNPMPHSRTPWASSCGLTELSSVDHSRHNGHPNRRRKTTTAVCFAHKLWSSTICEQKKSNIALIKWRSTVKGLQNTKRHNNFYETVHIGGTLSSCMVDTRMFTFYSLSTISKTSVRVSSGFQMRESINFEILGLQAEWFYCFWVFGNLMRPKAQDFTSPTKKN